MNDDSVRRDLCGLTHALATIILLNDDAAVAPGGRSARALPVAASCCRRRRAPGASSALRKLYVRFFKFKMEVRVFFYRAPRRPLQQKMTSSRYGICCTVYTMYNI